MLCKNVAQVPSASSVGAYRQRAEASSLEGIGGKDG